MRDHHECDYDRYLEAKFSLYNKRATFTIVNLPGRQFVQSSSWGMQWTSNTCLSGILKLQRMRHVESFAKFDVIILLLAMLLVRRSQMNYGIHAQTASRPILFLSYFQPVYAHAHATTSAQTCKLIAFCSSYQR